MILVQRPLFFVCSISLYIGSCSIDQSPFETKLNENKRKYSAGVSSNEMTGKESENEELDQGKGIDNNLEPHPKEHENLPNEIDANATANDFYRSLIRRSDALTWFDFQSQDEINARTKNVAKGDDPLNNENVIYDPTMGAARLQVAASLSLINRVKLSFPNLKSSGHLVAIWDYYPANDWAINNNTVHTHKMFMLGSDAASDNRTLEQRFHYSTGTEAQRLSWQVDTRPYFGGDTSGEGSGLGRLTPWNKTSVTVDRWHRFYAEVDFESEGGATYSVKVRPRGGSLMTVYDNISVNTLVASKGGLDFFDPTYANTSQDYEPQAVLTHGWLRNVVVLWSPSSIDMSEIYAEEVLQ